MTVETAQKSYEAARNKTRRLQTAKRNERYKKVQAIEVEVEEKHAPGIARAQASEEQALTKLNFAKVEDARTKGLPEGTIFEQWDYTGYGKDRKKKLTGALARLEVWMDGAERAKERESWRYPRLGERYLRLLKKNGTPGQRFVRASWNGEFFHWEKQKAGAKTKAGRC